MQHSTSSRLSCRSSSALVKTVANAGIHEVIDEQIALLLSTFSLDQDQEPADTEIWGGANCFKLNKLRLKAGHMLNMTW